MAWNLDYAAMVPYCADGYRTYYLPGGIKTLVRITLDLSEADKQYLENYSNPAPYITEQLSHWNNQIDAEWGRYFNARYNDVLVFIRLTEIR